MFAGGFGKRPLREEEGWRHHRTGWALAVGYPGIGCFTVNAASADHLVYSADQALYAVKYRTEPD